MVEKINSFFLRMQQFCFFFVFLLMNFSDFKTHLITAWKWSRESLAWGCKVVGIGQHTLTPLVYPNKHSLPPSGSRGYRQNPSQLPLPRVFNTAQPALRTFKPVATQDTHAHVHTHIHTHSHAHTQGISHTSSRVRKENVREGSAEASGKAETDSSPLSSFLLSIRSLR